MIEFLTLFLGLVVGVHPVQLSAAPGVAAIELRLDGRAAGVLQGAPWTLPVDFGEDLTPHLLEAVARDAGGRELGRTRQRLNVLRARAEARLTVERPDGRGPPTARLIWRALDFDRPRSVSLSFDGRPLEVANPTRFALPSYDPATIHLLRAELVFSNELHTDAELVLGGTFRDRVESELTAVVVRLPGKRLPAPAEMRGWFRVADRPLTPVAIERTPIDLLVVRERAAGTLADLARLRVTAARSERAFDPSLLGRLEPRDRVRFVFPAVERLRRAGQEQEQMPVSLDLAEAGKRSMFGILSGLFFDRYDVPAPRQRLADAVAIAGLVAAGSSRRRAVLLVENGGSEDCSRFPPGVVRSYLSRLQVPLIHWTFPHKGNRSEPAWGATEDLLGTASIHHAFLDLVRALDEQAVVWLPGSHLPGEIELERGAKISLVR